jgi:8-oxo-dGTP pyrophosphatase MutT (NUDIX family)
VKGFVLLADARRLAESLSRAATPVVPHGTYKRAAIFILLTRRAEPAVLMIERAQRGDPWSGHMAFPGGRIEAGDADARAAAYRETREEVGIAPEAITYVGDAGHFLTGDRSVDVHAFVGIWDGKQPVRIDAGEVAACVEIPLSDLMREHGRLGFASRSATRLGDRLEYRAGGALIWGVTARMTHFLLEWIGSAGGESERVEVDTDQADVGRRADGESAG